MNGASGRHWPSAVRVVSTHVVETGADDDVVNDMIHDRVVVRPLSRWCRFLMRYCVRGTALVMSFRFFITSRRNERTLSVVPEFLRTLVFARPRGDDQFADCTFSPSLDMSR